MLPRSAKRPRAAIRHRLRARTNCGKRRNLLQATRNVFPATRLSLMRFRKLRIAWSVGWGLACVLLIALWVRSCWWCDQPSYRLSAGYAVECFSIGGLITFSFWELHDPTLVWFSG